MCKKIYFNSQSLKFYCMIKHILNDYSKYLPSCPVKQGTAGAYIA